MNEYYEEGELNPGIEFIKVEPSYFDDDIDNDMEIEDPKEIQRITKHSSNVYARTHHNPLKNKIIRVQHHSKTNHGFTKMNIRPTAPAHNKYVLIRPKKTTILMSQPQCIALIKKVEKQSLIWDSTNENYKNKTLRDKTWIRVAAQMGLPVEIIRAKWTSILGSFRSYTSRQKKGLLTGKPRWYAYDLLSFLGNEIEQSSRTDDVELPYVYDDARTEVYEPKRTQNTAEKIMPQLRQDTMEYLEEALLLPEDASTVVNRTTEDSVTDEEPETSNNQEILRIVRSMSKVLNKMANIGMSVDYGRYVNQHLKGYDDEIRRKTVKGILDLITAADEEMSKKYPDRSQIPGVNVVKSHKN